MGRRARRRLFACAIPRTAAAAQAICPRRRRVDPTGAAPTAARASPARVKRGDGGFGPWEWADRAAAGRPGAPRRRRPHRRSYDCRHAAATTWLRAGVPLGEVASRLGHSVDALVSTYVGTINGDDEVANTRIETALAVRSWSQGGNTQGTSTRCADFVAGPELKRRPSGHQGQEDIYRVRSTHPAIGPPPAAETATSGWSATWRSPASPRSWTHASWSTQ
jgi:hypothetical protein